MSYHQAGAGAPDECMCRYGTSKLQFRGPQRALDGAYLACFGGEETFGRFVERPFAALIEQRLDRKCVNFGSLFCGLDALVHDPGLVHLANGAELCVIQVPGALGQSNRFYRVHPRRNDRFVAPTPDLITLYPEMDFTDVHFVGHLLSKLRDFQDARYELVIDDLQRQWVHRMTGLLCEIQRPVLLLWLHVQGEMAQQRAVLSGCDPLLVEAEMVQLLSPHCAACVELNVQVSGESDELEDMLFGTLQQPMAEYFIGPATHRRIADAICPAICDLN